MRKKLLTNSVLAQIPRWTECGLGPGEIAQKIGCTVGTLRVLCSRYRISLRRPSRSGQQRLTGPTRDTTPTNLVLSLPDETRVGLQARAGSLGLSDAELVSVLIDAIDRDDLYSAVLDDSR